MPKVNQIEIDEKGNMKVEFSCYDGNQCALEEARLREDLAALGVKIKVDWLQRKDPSKIASEVDPEKRHGGKTEVHS